VRAERAYAFARLAAVTEELGEPAKAAQLYREAIAALQPLVDEQPSAREYRVRLAATCRGLGLVLLRQTQARAAEPLFRQTLDLYQALAAEFPGDPAYQYHQAMSHNDLASVHLTVGEREPMKAALDEGLRLCRAAVAARPQDRAYQAGEADLHTNLARWYQLNDQVDGAEPELLTAVQLYQQLADAHPDEVFYQSNLADAQNRLAQSYIFRGSDVAAKAVPAFQKAVAGYEQLVRREPWVPKYQRDLAGLHLDLGSWYFERERWKEAESAYEAARATARKLADDYRDDVDNQIFLAKIMRNVGMIQAKQRRWADAEASYRESIAIKERLVGEYPEFVDHAFALGSTYSDLAMLLEDVSRFGESLECYTKAIGLLDGVFAKVATRSVGRDNLRNTLWGRANVLNKLGRHAEALADWDRALEWAGGEGFRVELRSHRARTLALLGDHERAAAEARAVAATNPVKGKVLYRLAAAFAVSAAACARDGLPERERLADDYAAAALTQLRKAAEAGYFKDQSVVDQLRRDADFAALTSAEFKKWLAELTAR
jgi:tetratricopeptide (TPR) repeat protein